MRPARIAFVVGGLDLGGAERQLVRLANNLDRARFEPSILCWFGAGALRDEVAGDVPVIDLGLEALRGSGPARRAVVGARLLRELYAAIRRQRPDVLHAYMFSAYVTGALAARLALVPVVIASRRGLVSFRDYPRHWQALARIANALIDVQVCNSEAVRDWALKSEKLPREQTRVVYNGLDLKPQASPRLPPEWLPDPGGVGAAMVANLIGYKRHALLLEALADVVQRHPNLKVVLFGEGTQRPAIEAQIAACGLARNVVLAGSVRDAAELLAAFDFTLLTSSEEGFPNSVMESMAAGVPVVATRVGGVPELVVDGVHGLLVPPDDAQALAVALERMIGNPAERRRMGAAGRHRIEAEFSVQRMVVTTEAIYEEELRRHGR